MSKKDDNDKIIHFPKLKKQHVLKKREEKEAKKASNAQKALEDKYRAEYHAARAKELSGAARSSAGGNGKVPFINWEKIPPFTRAAMGTFLIVQIIMSLFVSSADKIAIIYYFGFVPAMYTGGVEWSWSALIAPFTTLIIHSGWMHLGFNIIMMMIMGIFFEREFGSRRTVAYKEYEIWRLDGKTDECTEYSKTSLSGTQYLSHFLSKNAKNFPDKEDVMALNRDDNLYASCLRSLDQQ